MTLDISIYLNEGERLPLAVARAHWWLCTNLHRDCRFWTRHACRANQNLCRLIAHVTNALSSFPDNTKPPFQTVSSIYFCAKVGERDSSPGRDNNQIDDVLILYFDRSVEAVRQRSP